MVKYSDFYDMMKDAYYRSCVLQIGQDIYYDLENDCFVYCDCSNFDSSCDRIYIGFFQPDYDQEWFDSSDSRDIDDQYFESFDDYYFNEWLLSWYDDAFECFSCDYLELYDFIDWGHKIGKF